MGTVDCRVGDAREGARELGSLRVRGRAESGDDARDLRARVALWGAKVRGRGARENGSREEREFSAPVWQVDGVLSPSIMISERGEEA